MLNLIYGGKGWRVRNSIVSEKSIEVNLVIDQRYNFLCPHCGCKLRRFLYRETSVKALPIEGREVTLNAEVFCGSCPGCYKYSSLRPPCFHPTKCFTLSFMRTVSAEFVYAPAESLGYKYDIAPSTVRRIDRAVVKEQQQPPTRNGIEAILVDEKYLGPSSGFVTLVVNARSGEPLYMAPGKDKAALDGFFKELTAEQKGSIRHIGIDRGNAYRASALYNIPAIQICYDPFHIIANMNEVVDRVRRAAIKAANNTELQLLTNSRFLLLKDATSLDENATAKLQTLMACNQPLHLAYTLKEQLREVFRHKDSNAATWSMVRWVRMAIKSKVPAIVRFARGLAKALPDILNTIRSGMSSAKIESMNASIQRIMSKTCGMNDIPYLFAKLRQRFLLNRQIYRYRLMRGLRVGVKSDIVTPLG